MFFCWLTNIEPLFFRFFQWLNPVFFRGPALWKAAMVARACEDLEPLRVAIEKAREAEGLSNFTKVGEMKI